MLYKSSGFQILIRKGEYNSCKKNYQVNTFSDEPYADISTWNLTIYLLGQEMHKMGYHCISYLSSGISKNDNVSSKQNQLPVSIIHYNLQHNPVGLGMCIT